MPAKTAAADRPVVIVTGSSSGIGLATAQRLATRGRVVYGASRSRAQDAGWTQLAMDVTSDESVSAGVAEVISREGRIDALVHCAGVSLVGPFEDTTLAEARHHFELNYFGAYRVMQAILPTMRQQQRGRIIVVGSIGGLLGLPFLGQYCATKFALDGLVESMRPELSSFGIGVACVHPGDFRTALGANRIVSQATQSGTTYYQAFQRSLAFYNKAEAEARHPDVLARRIDRLIDQRSMPVRVVVGTPLEVLGVVAKRTLPSRLFERILGATYGG
jgi:NAD(P)-dependent dehydrogenase (short-subunit alcohol dehydrogenase family)